MFKTFAHAVRAQFKKMAKGELYIADISKSDLWEMYLDSFPEGTNEIYRERKKHDCNACKHFIKRMGNVVSIVDNKLITIWDILTEEPYQTVADSLSSFVKMAHIRTKFLYNESIISKAKNQQLLEDGTVREWNHLSCEIPRKFIDNEYTTVLAGISATKQVFERGLEELTEESLEITLDLIHQNAIYRGEEFKESITSFATLKRGYITLKREQEKNLYIWSHVDTLGARIRNSAIGTLLQDISDGVELTDAVGAFEAKVAPTNYKRSSAPISKGMVTNAMKTIADLGIEPSLHRRFAKLEDVSINNVLFADRNVSPLMKDSLETLLMNQVAPSTKSYSDITEIRVEDFIAKVLPTANSLELLVRNKHHSNFMSLIAPVDSTAQNILKWNNNFSWSYSGNITDSMKENVKKAGGNVEGVLRFSIQWNDKEDNHNDLDAHCDEPNSNTIMFNNKMSKTSGSLDIDITDPKGVAVENIIYTDLNKMAEGIYTFSVHNYTERGGKNFSAEIEFGGKIFSFNYTKKMQQSEKLMVAKVKYSQKEGFTIIESFPHNEISQNIWGIATEKFHKVSSVMLSPNHWDGQNEGNRHFFFLLENCINPEEARGIYNEFLDHQLTPHRKVFEVLADKMKCPITSEQISGIGFSTTQRSEIICKVTGSFTRTVKITF